MAILDYLPLQQGKLVKSGKKNSILTPVEQKSLSKAMKVVALSVGFESIPTFLNKRANFESSPYDFDKINEAIDTDSYAKQAISKYKELFWKEGWQLIGENPDAVNYLWQRIDYMEIAMQRPFQEFLTEVVDQLVRFHNVFIVKARGNLAPYFPGRLVSLDGKDPIIGYYVLPTEQIEILRDKNNKPKWYRQRMETSALNFQGGEVNQPTWKAEDVIHLHRDRKPGRAFGTPFIITALDDILSLRQLEEDILNLTHRELFPLYKYIIGTDEHPADENEVEEAAAEVESLRTDGAIVLPHRHDVEVIGGDSAALDVSGYLPHFKERVANGLGVYPHHLGMATGTATKDVTDRLDIALYDKVKEYQAYIENALRFWVLNELLMEGNFDPIAAPQEQGVSDRCMFKFSEIDVDTQIKKEAHTINKVTANLVDVPEGRMDIGMPPELDESNTVLAMQARMTPPAIQPSKNKDGSQGAPHVIDTTPEPARRDGQQASSKGGRPNPRNLRKGSANVIRPINQHGMRTSPNVRHSDVPGWLEEVVDLLDNNVNE